MDSESRLGRFLSADSVQPNAPGTQGYNLYAYVANNPTTWVDPSGHSWEGAAMLTAYIMANPEFMGDLLQECAPDAPTPGDGLAFAVCVNLVTIFITVPVLVCALTPECMEQAWEWHQVMVRYGVPSKVKEAQSWGKWTWKMINAAKNGDFPPLPPRPAPANDPHPSNVPRGGDRTTPPGGGGGGCPTGVVKPPCSPMEDLEGLPAGCGCQSRLGEEDACQAIPMAHP